MASLNQRIQKLENRIKELEAIIFDMTKNSEEKQNKPYSKIKRQSILGNMDLVYDGDTDLWKTYAVYKDDEE